MDFPKTAPSVGLVNGRFVDEDLVAGKPGSLIVAQWANQVTDEVIAVIKDAGLSPKEADSTQLLQSIKLILGKSVVSVTGTGALTGGGKLDANRTIDASAATKASLAKAESAVQPGRFGIGGVSPVLESFLSTGLATGTYTAFGAKSANATPGCPPGSDNNVLSVHVRVLETGGIHFSVVENSGSPDGVRIWWGNRHGSSVVWSRQMGTAAFRDVQPSRYDTFDAVLVRGSFGWGWNESFYTGDLLNLPVGSNASVSGTHPQIPYAADGAVVVTGLNSRRVFEYTAFGTKAKFISSSDDLVGGWVRKGISNTGSIGQTGWWRCGDTGLLRQWGASSAINADESITITLPVSPPNGIVNVQATLISNVASTNGAQSAYAQVLTKNTFALHHDDTMRENRPMQIYWEAICR